MYLAAKVDQRKFIKTNKKILKIKEYLTLNIENNEGYISNGIIEQANSYYFGKINKKEEYRLLSKLELAKSNIQDSYYDYLLTLDKFIKECKDIQIIKYKGD